MSRYVLHAEAVSDLEEIFEYTHTTYGLDAAHRFENLLIEAFELLAGNPGLGHLRQDLTSRQQLFYPVGPYLIVYARRQQPLRIIGILHGSRHARRLLRKRRG